MGHLPKSFRTVATYDIYDEYPSFLRCPVGKFAFSDGHRYESLYSLNGLRGRQQYFQQVSDVPPKKASKTMEDKEIEQVDFVLTGLSGLGV